jgi:hypothetical protein
MPDASKSVKTSPQTPLVIVCELGDQPVGLGHPGKGSVGAASRNDRSTWSGIAVADDRILAEFIPNANVGKGLVAIFSHTRPHHGDVIRFAHQSVSVSVVKANAKLGLMLLSAAAPGGTAYPEFAEPVMGEKVEWLRFPHEDYPKEFGIDVLSDELIARLPAGTFVFNDNDKRLIAMVTTDSATKKTQFLPVRKLKEFLTVSPAVPQSSPVAGSPQSRGFRSGTFDLNQTSAGGVSYGLDGSYTLRSREVVVVIQAGRVVAHQSVVLHSLQLGVCGFSKSFFSRDLGLGDVSLKAGDSYSLPLRTITIQLPADLPDPNWLCSTLTESSGNDVATGIRRPNFIPTTSDAWRHKKTADWSDSETRDFLTESPWAHTALIQIPSDSVVNGHHGSGGVVKRAVRWESAPLLRHALGRIESKAYTDALASLSRDYYVIAVVSEESPSANDGDVSSQWGPEQLEKRRQEKQTGPFKRTGLLKHADQTISPASIVSGKISQGWVDLFLFSRTLAFETRTGNLEFNAAFPAGMGRASFRVNFSLKDLTEGSERGL